MKKIILALALALLMTSVICGQKHHIPTARKTYKTGYQFLLSNNDYVSFKYSRTFSTLDDNFITTYKIYHPTKGTHILTITATHYRNEKKVEVITEEADGGIFAQLNKEETTYDVPSSEIFGFRGDVGILRGKKVPNQLAVKFLSSKFEYIKVLSVLGSNYNNDFEFFILDNAKVEEEQNRKKNTTKTNDLNNYNSIDSKSLTNILKNEIINNKDVESRDQLYESPQNRESEILNNKVEDKEDVYEVIEQMPVFPGGEAELLNFIKLNLKYPAKSAENGIEGKVIIQFLISKTGYVTSVTVKNSLDSLCDEEAVRVIKLLPKFKPGKRHDENVSVWYTLPITFRL